MALQPQPTASFRKHVLALIGETYGDKTLCLCPTGFVRLFRGDHKAAILLSQILYWAERTKDPDGWFYKSYADWRAETGLTEAQVRRTPQWRPARPVAAGHPAHGRRRNQAPESQAHRRADAALPRQSGAADRGAADADGAGRSAAQAQGRSLTLQRIDPQHCWG